MRFLRYVCSLVILASTMTLAQSNPVPLINNPLVPAAAPPGSASFTLTVNGTGFVSGSVVNWNDKPLATSFVSSSQVTASVPHANLATASTASVKVINPLPGGGPSNVACFEIVNVVSSVDLVYAASLPPTPSGPGNFVTGDFNRDGKLDIATVNESQSNGEMLVYLGNGDGTFQRPKTYITGSYPYGIVAGDFNHDGKLDLAVTNYLSNTISIFLGKGDGNFTSFGSFATDKGPFGINVADYNGDGNLDLAVADQQGAPTDIFLGNGDGTFQAPIKLPDLAAFDLVTADFNHDGRLDLAAFYDYPSDEFSVMFGNGDGTFQPPVYYQLGFAFNTLTGVDFNGDGNLDLAFPGYEKAEVLVALGNADGTFQAPQAYSAPENALWITNGDVNGDGKPDLLVSSEFDYDYNDCEFGCIGVLLGNGDGTFQAPVTFGGPAGYNIGSAIVGDFNNDGKADVVGSGGVGLIWLEGPIPAVSLSPLGLGFRAQAIGVPSIPATVTLTNSGNATLTVSSIVTAGNFSQTNTCGAAVAGGASCTISVIFTPLIQGRQQGTVVISDNALIEPQTIYLSGTGTYVVLSPASLSFGNVPVHTKSAPQTVTLTNTGSSSLTIDGVSTSYGYSQTNTCGSTVPPGGNCTLSVTLRPPKTGPFGGKLEVTDSSGGSQTVFLFGFGVKD
jgi:hypothetical protein